MIVGPSIQLTALDCMGYGFAYIVFSLLVLSVAFPPQIATHQTDSSSSFS